MNPINSISKLFALIILSAIVLVAAASHVSAAGGEKNRSKSKSAKMWRQIDEGGVQSRGQRTMVPEKYLVFRLNQTALQTELAKLPLENSDAARSKPLLMEVPMPDGGIELFRMEETQVLSPELAAQYPTWKTFVGYGVDNPQAIGRFDWNVNGFHGYVEISGKGVVFIDPYQRNDKENYLVFYKHEFGARGGEFSCGVGDPTMKLIETQINSVLVPSAPEFSFGAQVRTYRIAVATTGEWSRNAAGFGANPNLTPRQIREGALAVVMTSVNRLTGIFVRELASQFQVVNPPVNDPNNPANANANNIIFDDPTTDPYDNTDSATPQNDQLAINQTTIDARVGTANYDIGHLYGTGGGGVAGSPTLCTNAKAQGYSARGNDIGDPFVVDYVAHEIGHQFGADHTYNTADNGGACTTRSGTDAFEPASGSTIMSYVGICAAGRNLQRLVDPGLPMFHIRSLTTINTNIMTGAPSQPGCGTAAPGANAIPTVTAGNNFTIPRLTPFTLTATGGDADPGDITNKLLYSWEEYDLAPSATGALGTPANSTDTDDDNVARPILRAYSPVESASRTFPSLNFILNPATNDPAGSNQPPLTYMGAHPTGAPGAVCETGQTCVLGERLPTINRAMNFRVSVRDRRGGVADAGTIVTVNRDAGPFRVTEPEVMTWQGGSTQTVRWDVAGTTLNNINTANVKISLSTDGGQTFLETPILASTPNDGSQEITVPNNPTTTARIKVEAVGNIFFDINNANFTITGTTSAGVSVAGRVAASNGRGISGALVTVTDQNGALQTARTNALGYYRFSDLDAGQTYVFNVSHKRYQFTPRVTSIAEDISGFDFVAGN